MSRNLVLTRAGRSSLHAGWIDPEHPRNFDLVLVPYQEIEPQDGVDCVVMDVVPGPKWAGLRRALNEWDGWRAYDRIWMPDDDIATDPATISRMFDVADAVGLDLFAPALDRSSYYAHFITMENPRFYGRWVGFVEIMVPGFRRAALERLLPTLDLTQTGWGWGLDSVWPKLLGYENVGIIDGTPVLHTQPVGRVRDPELGRRVLDESARILAAYGCRQMHTTFAAFGPDLARLELTEDELTAELVGGWQYLTDADPRILPWISAFQQPPEAHPDYPVAGTPDGAPPEAATRAATSAADSRRAM